MIRTGIELGHFVESCRLSVVELVDEGLVLIVVGILSSSIAGLPFREQSWSFRWATVGCVWVARRGRAVLGYSPREGTSIR